MVGIIKPMWAVSGSQTVLLLLYCRNGDEVSEGISVLLAVVSAVQLRAGKNIRL
jgi:hypothetical protein